MFYGIEKMDDYEGAIKRVEAWYHGEVIDRAPVRFSKHNADYDINNSLDTDRWESLEDRWFDAEYQVDSFIAGIEDHSFRAESFPVFWPNLGPEVASAFYGMDLEFGEVTSWAKPPLEDAEDQEAADRLVFRYDNRYYRNLLEQTKIALEKCKSRYLVGVSSWSTGIDTVAGWIEPEQLCMDILTSADEVKKLLRKSEKDFKKIYDEFYHLICTCNGHPSVSWMGIPTISGKGHILQADFSNMISTEHFDEFCKPSLEYEVGIMDRLIFHLDGKGVANHIDSILAMEKIHAVQWVQGVGMDEPIMQWVELIRKIQGAGKSVVVDLKTHELEEFISEIGPEGIFLCIDADDGVQDDITERLLKWK